MTRIRRRTAWAAILTALTWAWAAPGPAWEIPLTVAEQGAAPGLRHVTCGVPLLAGQAKDPAKLRLAVKGADGKLTAVPAQFRVLARWWRADNSIRWVLVDFAATVAANQKKTFYLTDAELKRPKPAAALTVEKSPGAIVVTTGPARFVISRKKFTFLQHAFIDDNADGRFADGEDLLATTPGCGTVLAGTHGEEYFSSADTRSVEVLEAGPVRVQVRARGMHRAREGGYSHGMYSYDYYYSAAWS